MNKLPVWIDTDCGVDDALALLVAMALDELEIVGISAVAGNVELVNTYKNTRNVVALAGKETQIPVYKGSDAPILRPLETASAVHGNDGLGGVVIPESTASHESKNAIDAMYEACVKHSGKIQIVAIGPLTNIAKAFMKYPDLKDHVKRILFMGGAIVGGNTTPCAEFNAYVDPEACEVVLNCGVPVVMAGLDCTMKTYFTMEELNAMRGLNKIADFVVDCSQDILSLYQKAIGSPRVILHDTCPFLYLVHEEFFDGQMAGVHCESRGKYTRGKTVGDVYTDHKFETQNCFVLLDADRSKVTKFVYHLLESKY